MDTYSIIVIWIICGIVGAVVAGNKNRSAFGWFLLVVLFTPLLLIVLACLKSLPDPNAQTAPIHEPSSPISVNINNVPESQSHKTRKCPYCAEDILLEATLCKHCKSQITHEVSDHGLPAEPKA